MTRPLITVREVRLFQRSVRLRLPFKFGAATLTEALQVFVRVEIETDSRRGTGQSAELLAPKWFDKNPALTNEDNVDQLLRSLRHAARLYTAETTPRTAFALHASLQPDQYRACGDDGLNRLIAGYGTALVDRAVLDASCRMAGMSVFEAVRANLPGITAHATPDLYPEHLDTFLAARPQPTTIAVRHTVGMADALTDADVADPIGDGLPESLEAVIAAYGNSYFKLKVGADVEETLDRLARVASVLDRSDGRYFVTLDANEQFADVSAVLELVGRIETTPTLERLWASTLYIEQPISRALALSEPIHAVARRKPVAIDESDADIGVFPVARALGYAATSVKSCKGFYRGLLNTARAARWNREAGGGAFFTIAEDLTTQPGIALQQDLALAALVGATHVERNGHHYVDGFAGAPAAEQACFAGSHPDLYGDEGGRIRLRIQNGMLAINSLDTPGLAAACEPDWGSMEALDC